VHRPTFAWGFSLRCAAGQIRLVELGLATSIGVVLLAAGCGVNPAASPVTDAPRADSPPGMSTSSPDDETTAPPASAAPSSSAPPNGSSSGDTASPEELSFLINRASARDTSAPSTDPVDRLSALREQVHKDPRNTRLLCETAALYLHEGRHAEAAPYLDRALAIDADHFDALRLRGVVSLLRGRYPAAASDLSRVIEHNPDDAEALAWRAAARLNLGDAEGTSADATAALEAGSQQAEPYFLRCLARGRLGQLTAAAADLAEARRRGLPDDRARFAEEELSRASGRDGPSLSHPP
jgi:predicted Zn-dependent protease